MNQKTIDEMFGDTIIARTQARVQGKLAAQSNDPAKVLEGYRALDEKPIAQMAYVDGARQAGYDTSKF